MDQRSLYLQHSLHLVPTVSTADLAKRINRPIGDVPCTCTSVCGQVYHAVLVVSGEDFAVKVMDKRHIIRENKVQYVKLEKNILNQLDHPGVVKLRFTFQDEGSLCELGFLSFLPDLLLFTLRSLTLRSLTLKSVTLGLLTISPTDWRQYVSELHGK